MRNLKLSDREYSFLEAIPDAAICVGVDRRVVACNALAISFLDANPIGLEITQLIRTQVFADSLRLVQDTVSAIDFEMEFYGIKRQLSHVLIRRIAEPKGCLIFIRDFTREQAVEKMRSDFVAHASHEMRTPLASIIGSIETLQGAARNDPQAREQFLGTMLTQAQRMKRLIDDLLTLSRIELNEHVVPDTRVVLNDVVQQAKQNLEIGAKEAKVNVNLDETENIIVAGDPEELLQVVQNLLENAIKYGASGGRIEMNCYAHTGQGCLAVRDFGRGIAEIHIPRLTERFYRVSTQESRSRGGTGLGLAIVKHILLRHRGKLTVSSTEGEGSTFTISIPLVNSAV